MAHSFIRYAVGIDVSMDHFHVCFKGLTDQDEEKIIGTRKFTNTDKGLGVFKKWIEQKRKVKNIPCRILMEVTGVYHENLLYFLHKNGYYVSLEQGRRVKNYLKSLGYDSKTDKDDSKGIASMALYRTIKEWKPVSQSLHQIRQMVRYRSSLIDNKVAFQNQLHAIKHSRFTHRDIISSIKRLVGQTEKDIKAMEDKIKKLVKEDQQLWSRMEPIIQSFPGVGFITLITILAEADGFSSIESAKQLTKYAGYDVIQNQSGRFSGKTRISKQGNARLRKTMYMPALALVRTKKTPLYDLYLRLVQRNGGLKKKAQVAVQRKMLCIIFTLWKSGEKYDPEYHLKQQKITDKNLQNGSSPDTKSGLHEIVLPEEELLIQR